MVEIDIAKEIIRFFGPLFSGYSKSFTTSDSEVIDVYDIPTQLFLFNENTNPIYSTISEEMEQVVYKVMKENQLDNIPSEAISYEHITQFRRQFWAYPEVEQKLKVLLETTGLVSEIEVLNRFFEEMVRNSVYMDKDLVALREFRIFIAKKSIAFEGEISGDMYNDLFYFLDFGRFNTDDYVVGKAEKVLKKICAAINNGSCPDMRKFKSFADWNTVPLEIVSEIEKLVLLNYCDKPNKNVVREIRIAVEKMDLNILKKYLDFTPVEWQRYALIFESRENLAANSRRSGKSFLAVYIAIRQIFLPGQMILYLLPVKEDYSEQPFFYIEQMLENVKKMGAELNGFQFNAKQFKCVNKNFKSKIIFISAQGSSKGKSFSANLVIIDEAAYIDDPNIYEQVSNSTSDTKGRMWSISTINVDTPINRFFFKKVALDGTEDCRVMNIDIWNNPFLTDSEKRRKELQYKGKNEKVWLADWMAIFVGGADGFDVSKFFQINFNYDVVTFKGSRFNLVRKLDDYNKFLLAYDPAKNMDKAGLALIGLIGQRAEVIMTGYLDIQNYFLQRDVIIDIINYISKFGKCELAIDLGKAGEAANDFFEQKKIAPYGILSTGGNTTKKVTFRRRHVPADMQEKNLHSLLSAGVVTGYSWLDKIKNEFETYNLSKERKGNVGHHHDVLSALMMAVYIWYERKLINFDKKKLVTVNTDIKYDSNGLPIRRPSSGSYDPTRHSKFLY